jgi:beta-lactamase class D
LTLFSLFLLVTFPTSSLALTSDDSRELWHKRDACHIIANLKTGKILKEYNAERCKKRLPPCSSFKIAAAVMGFSEGILRSEDQQIKWDGVARERQVLNQDQTPTTWMQHSAMWVTQWLIPQIGLRKVSDYLRAYGYGNADFSGGLARAWQMSSLKISAREQVEFVSKLWSGKLSAPKAALAKVRNIMFIKRLPGGGELYGKTGTGCLEGTACLTRPDKMLGWFVGVARYPYAEYAVVANASDLENAGPPAGPRARDTVVEVFARLRKEDPKL